MSFGSFVALLRFVLLAIATFSGSRSNAAAASFLDSENIGSGGFQAIVQEGTFMYDGSVNIHAASAASRGGGVLLAEGEDFVDSSIFPARLDEPHATRGAGALRQQYVRAVGELGEMVPSMRASGASPEAIARALHAERRAIGEQFKILTDPAVLEKIYERNLTRYGDKLGPSIDWLRAQGKTWGQIIESATRTGGKDLGL